MVNRVCGSSAQRRYKKDRPDERRPETRLNAHALLGCLVLAVLCTSVPSSEAVAPAPRDPSAAIPARPTSEVTAEALAESVHGDWAEVKNTGSMLPVLSASDLVVTRPVNIRDLRVGDIVVFVVPARTLPDGQLIQHPRVVHRVVQRLDCDKRGYCHRVRTQGDNVKTPDRWSTTQANLAGRVVYVVDGRTGAVRDMRASRKGVPISVAAALRRELGPDRLSGALFADAVRALAGG
jgi:signal peptidase I